TRIEDVSRKLGSAIAEASAHAIQRERLEQEYSASCRELDTVRSESRSRETRVQSLTAELDASRTTLDEQKRHARGLEADLATQRTHGEQLTLQVDRTRAELIHAKSDAADSRLWMTELHAEMARMKQSGLWRIMSPARWFGNWMSGAKRQDRASGRNRYGV